MEPRWLSQLKGLRAVFYNALVNAIIKAQTADDPDIIDLFTMKGFNVQDFESIVEYVLNKNGCNDNDCKDNDNDLKEDEHAENPSIAEEPPAEFNTKLKERWPRGPSTPYNLFKRKCLYWSWNELDFGHHNNQYRKHVDEWKWKYKTQEKIQSQRELLHVCFL